MTKQDWMTACMTAVMVAMTVALLAPPVCWAEQTTPVAIPALPSAQLTIPSINGEVSATATPAPGETVKVTLALQCPSGSKVEQVPVTITVLSTTMNPLSRSLPPSKQVAQVSAVVPVGPDGNGSAVVALPLTWAVKSPAKPDETANKDLNLALNIQQTVTSYQMVLSSTLGGQAAPANLRTMNNVQIQNLANARLTVTQNR